MDFEPPFDSTLPARRHWDRLSKEIHSQERWPCISRDLPADFCQVLALSQQCMSAILADGVLVSGARSEREKVRHPLFTPWSQCQSTLIKLARSIPLVNPSPDTDGAQWDEFLQAVMADGEPSVSFE
jgi:phage terminase small subunit